MDLSIARTNITRQVAALQALNAVIDTDPYRELQLKLTLVAKKIPQHTRVLMAGVGKNASIASKISDTMVSLGISSHALNVSHLGHGDFGRIGNLDLVIHISRSGTTREMLEAIEHIALIHPMVSQVLIHCNPTKAKNEFVDIELCIGAVQEGDEHGLAPTTSTTALLCILDSLSVQASHDAGFKRMDFLMYHPDGALGKLLAQEKDKAACANPCNKEKCKAKDCPEPGLEAC